MVSCKVFLRRFLYLPIFFFLLLVWAPPQAETRSEAPAQPAASQRVPGACARGLLPFRGPSDRVSFSDQKLRRAVCCRCEASGACFPVGPECLDP